MDRALLVVTPTQELGELPVRVPEFGQQRLAVDAAGGQGGLAGADRSGQELPFGMAWSRCTGQCRAGCAFSQASAQAGLESVGCL